MCGDRCRRCRGAWLALAGLALVVAAGCGSGNKPYPVRGRLVYDDNDQPVKELANYDVTFTSEALGKSARGTIRQDGSFELGSLSEKDGAYPGEYVVILTQPHRKPERVGGDPVVDLAYEDPARTDLKAEVKRESNEFTFRLRRIRK